MQLYIEKLAPKSVTVHKFIHFNIENIENRGLAWYFVTLPDTHNFSFSPIPLFFFCNSWSLQLKWAKLREAFPPYGECPAKAMSVSF